MSLYGLLSLLLQYPDAEILAAREDLTAAAAELPEASQRRPVERFLEWFSSASASELQREYVSTFDFAKRSSLYLSYHTHGDRRDRGMVLVRLKQRYASAGLRISERDLPDFLPAMLEFAALAPDGVGEKVLSEQREAIELVRASLARESSPYGHLLDALCAALPALTIGQRENVARIAAEGPPTEQVGLEPFAPPEVMPEPSRSSAVTFGGGS
jgi:nitrate reductase delta subunit